MQGQKRILPECLGVFQICGVENGQDWPDILQKGLYHEQEFSPGPAWDGKCPPARAEIWRKIAKCGRITIFSASSDFLHFWVFQGQIGGDKGKKEIQSAESSPIKYFAQAQKIFYGTLQGRFLPKHEMWVAKITGCARSNCPKSAFWQRNWDKIRKRLEFGHFDGKNAKKAEIGPDDKSRRNAPKDPERCGIAPKWPGKSARLELCQTRAPVGFSQPGRHI